MEERIKIDCDPLGRWRHPSIRIEDVLNHSSLKILGLIHDNYAAGNLPYTIRGLNDAAYGNVNNLPYVQLILRRLRAANLIDYQDSKARTIVPKCRLELIGATSCPKNST